MLEEQGKEQTLTLKLTLIDAQGLKDFRFLGKLKSFAIVWIKPQFKQTTKTLTSKTPNPNWNFYLSFPLSLQNPNSQITIQILSHLSPIHHQRVIGSTILSVSEVQFDDQVFTLQLWRPSGRAQGLIRVSARVERGLGFYRGGVGCVTGIPVEANYGELQTLVQEPISVIPSAPPMSEESNIWRSVLVGFLGGAVAIATVLVGANTG